MPMQMFSKEWNIPASKTRAAVHAAWEEQQRAKEDIRAEVLKDAYPQSNIVAVDYDPGASEVNQLNRIKLMLASANEKLDFIPV